MAQWKRAGPITQRSEDQNLALLDFCLFVCFWFVSLFFVVVVFYFVKYFICLTHLIQIAFSTNIIEYNQKDFVSRYKT